MPEAPSFLWIVVAAAADEDEARLCSHAARVSGATDSMETCCPSHVAYYCCRRLHSRDQRGSCQSLRSPEVGTEHVPNNLGRLRREISFCRILNFGIYDSGRVFFAEVEMYSYFNPAVVAIYFSISTPTIGCGLGEA
jgi:hypothetical protein